MDTREIIRLAGGPSKLAKALGLDHSTVLGWRHVPLRHVVKVAEIVELPPTEISPVWKSIAEQVGAA